MNTDPSRRKAILVALLARVQDISVAHGYRTDVGATVFVGEAPTLGPDDPIVAAAIVIGDDEVTATGGNKLLLALPIECQALARADIEAPYLAVEDVLADLKAAIELDDRTLGGLVGGDLARGTTRTMEREPGATTVGVSISYQVPYRERWGHPED